METKIKFCVDDFGLAEGINAAALQLAQEERIQAISALVIYPDSAATLSQLIPLNKSIQIGLHICLTGTQHKPIIPASADCGYVCDQGFFLDPYQLFMNLIIKKVNLMAVEAEVLAQLSVYSKILGSPKHIDSHHHIHQWPGLSQAVLKAVSVLSATPLVRNTRFPYKILIQNPSLKFIFLHICGILFSKKIKKRGIPTNIYFGTYPSYRTFSENHWHQLMKKYSQLNQSSLWAVHPSQNVKNIFPKDTLTTERVLEYNCFFSHQSLTQSKTYNAHKY